MQDITLSDYITLKAKPKSKVLANANRVLANRGFKKAKDPKDLNIKLNEISTTNDGVLDLLRIHPDADAILMAFDKKPTDLNCNGQDANLNCCGSSMSANGEDPTLNCNGCSMSANGERLASPETMAQIKKEEKENEAKEGKDVKDDKSYFSENKTTLVLAFGLILVSALFIYKK